MTSANSSRITKIVNLPLAALGALIGLLVGLVTLPQSEREELKKERAGKKILKNRGKPVEK